MMPRRSMLFTALAISLVTGCAAPEATGEDEGSTESHQTVGTVEAMFAQPGNGANATDHTLLTRVATLISMVPAGETIHAAIHSIDDPEVTAALKAASDRKVHVRISFDGSETKKGTYADLNDALSKDELKACGTKQNGGCIAHKDGSIMHSKIYTFSKIVGPSGKVLHKNAVWMGSANMTAQTGANTWNNAVIVYDNNALYEKVESKILDPMWNEKHDSNLYDASTGRGLIKDDPIVVQASPSPDLDLVSSRLKSIDPKKGCVIRISQNMFTAGRPEVMNQVARLSAKCKVKMLLNHGPNMVAPLQAAGVDVKYSKTHDKLFLVENGGDKLVFTGSHNWSQDANDVNDEVLVRVDNAAAWEAFDGYYKAQWAAGLDASKVTSISNDD